MVLSDVSRAALARLESESWSARHTGMNEASSKRRKTQKTLTEQQHHGHDDSEGDDRSANAAADGNLLLGAQFGAARTRAAFAAVHRFAVALQAAGRAAGRALARSGARRVDLGDLR